MGIKRLLDIETHDPAGRRVLVSVDVEAATDQLIYSIVETVSGQPLAESWAFRTGERLPDYLEAGKTEETIQVIVDKIRYPHAKLIKH